MSSHNEDIVSGVNNALYQLGAKFHRRLLSHAQYLTNVKELLDYTQAELSTVDADLTPPASLSSAQTQLPSTSTWGKFRSRLKQSFP